MLPPFAVTPFYAALSGLLLVVLAFAVIVQRRKNRVSLGDGGKHGVLRAMRAQANFVEYTPLALLLLFLLELSRQPLWALHLLGATLVLGRVLHAWGLLTAVENRGPNFGRMAGMILTLSMLLVAAIWLLLVALPRLGG